MSDTRQIVNADGILRRRRRAMDDGVWLPPGGSVAWGPMDLWIAAVVLGLRDAICDELHCERGSVEIHLEPDPSFPLPLPAPRVALRLPDSWICPGAIMRTIVHAGAPTKPPTAEEAIRDTVKRLTADAVALFHRNLGTWTEWVGAPLAEPVE